MAENKKDEIRPEDADHGKTIFQWQFPEFPKYERDKKWYTWGAVAVVLFLLYSVFAANFLFGLITIIAALIVMLFHRSENTVDFEITEDGIAVGKSFYEYKKIKNFYIFYEPPEIKTLYFEPKNIFSPRIPISLENENPVKIREVLRQYLEEDLEREHEPVSDQTSRMFKL
ncbi:MAG: DUF5673 domain-containing protein [Patescibacteria group bacterium]|jgi:hypothetical protein